MKTKITALVGGSLLISLSINTFFLPYKILDGGIIGLALIFYYQWNFSVGATIILLSIPIYWYAWFYYRDFFYNSIAGLIVSALFIDLFSFLTFDFLSGHPLSSAITGGLLLGFGVGIMFLTDISTGGFDLFAQMISESTKINVGIMILIIDLLAIAPGVFVLTFEELILSTIAILATGVSTTIVTFNLYNDTNTKYSFTNR